jgi:hypothetical protein
VRRRFPDKVPVSDLCDERGPTARAILEPVSEFDPVVKDAAVTLPPMSLVRVTCRQEA